MEQQLNYEDYVEMVSFLRKHELTVKRYEECKKAVTDYLKKGNHVSGVALKTYRKASISFRKGITYEDVRRAMPTDINEDLFSKRVLMAHKDLPQPLQNLVADLVEETAPVVGVVLTDEGADYGI